MKAGIIAEGRGDLAVITNILRGVLNIDRSDVQYLVPELVYDETDLAVMRPAQFSTWSLVRQHCLERTTIDHFFNIPIADNRFLVIHLDTAERSETNYDVPLPIKNDAADYVMLVRENVANKMREWLDNHDERTTFAVAVEETDAWVLTIYEEKPETGHYPRPKERLQRTLNQHFKEKERKLFFQLKVYDQYLKLTDAFRKPKNLTVCRQKNKSLDLFCASLEQLASS